MFIVSWGSSRPKWRFRYFRNFFRHPPSGILFSQAGFAPFSHQGCFFAIFHCQAFFRPSRSIAHLTGFFLCFLASSLSFFSVRPPFSYPSSFRLPRSFHPPFLYSLPMASFSCRSGTPPALVSSSKSQGMLSRPPPLWRFFFDLSLFPGAYSSSSSQRKDRLFPSVSQELFLEIFLPWLPMDLSPPGE